MTVSSIRIVLRALGLAGLLALPGPAQAGALEDAQQGEQALARGRASEAVALFTRAIDSGGLSGSNLVITYVRRGQAYLAVGERARALADFNTVINANPRNPAAYNLRGIAHLEQHDYDAAIADFSRSIQLKPDYAEAYNNRAQAYMAKGSLGRPLLDLRRAITVAPDNPISYRLRGNLYFYQGNYGAAAADFTKHAELAPGDPYNAIRLYLALRRSGQDAAQRLRELTGTVPADQWPRPIIDLYLGGTTAERVLATVPAGGDTAARERACEAYFYVGYYYLLNGDNGRAAELFQRALDTQVPYFNEYRSAEAELWRLRP